MAEGDEIIGVFVGLESSSYEYIANIVAPYKTDFSIELGSFLLIQDHPSALVARVIDFVPQGELTSFMGLKWLSDVALESDAIGSDIKKRKISYSVKIKILGSLNGNKFNPGLRRIPHITSKVVKASQQTIKQIINQALEEQTTGDEVGSYFLDENIKVKFKMSELDSKRTFIFARAGYGKSNLMKVLATKWKKEFGSLVIFDPEGEYAFTDKKKRPGVMDSREAIFITNRKGLPETKNVYPNLRLNLKELNPKLILPIIIPVEKHETIFFSKLMGLSQEEWINLVDLFYAQGWRAPTADINRILNLDEKEESSMIPIRNNLANPIRTMHDPNSSLLKILETGMKQGEVIIVDISLLDSRTALWLSSIIVKHVFNKNQENFIAGSDAGLIKATFVMEEAQSVLSKESNVSAFTDLAKEGRKYSLGGIFITQQPSSIPFEILSQSDNFFVFHLLSKGDLDSLQRANAHYSNDIITQILNEPIKGKCYMWTSSQPFVLPVRINNFEEQNTPNKSIDVQSKSDLLANIRREVEEKLSDPTFKSILKKYRDIQNDSKIDPNRKAVELFKKCDAAELGYLRKENAIKKDSAGIEFAINFKYYGTLSVYTDLE